MDSRRLFFSHGQAVHERTGAKRGQVFSVEGLECIQLKPPRVFVVSGLISPSCKPVARPQLEIGIAILAGELECCLEERIAVGCRPRAHAAVGGERCCSSSDPRIPPYTWQQCRRVLLATREGKGALLCVDALGLGTVFASFYCESTK